MLEEITWLSWQIIQDPTWPWQLSWLSLSVALWLNLPAWEVNRSLGTGKPWNATLIYHGTLARSWASRHHWKCIPGIYNCSIQHIYSIAALAPCSYAPAEFVPHPQRHSIEQGCVARKWDHHLSTQHQICCPQKRSIRLTINKALRLHRCWLLKPEFELRCKIRWKQLWHVFKSQSWRHELGVGHC